LNAFQVDVDDVDATVDDVDDAVVDVPCNACMRVAIALWNACSTPLDGLPEPPP
jgi:hypothetical protein